jgi:hypothetical protein
VRIKVNGNDLRDLGDRSTRALDSSFAFNSASGPRLTSTKIRKAGFTRE